MLWLLVKEDAHRATLQVCVLLYNIVLWKSPEGALLYLRLWLQDAVAGVLE